MTEAYLHFLWKLKRLPFHLFKTTEGKEIHVVSNGLHNLSESGPDFFNARMIFDGMEWAGQIEIHLKSSDWMAHKHQFDPAYNNVMLHVVYTHDQEIYVNGNALPTIELKHFIDQAHFEKWKVFEIAMHEIPCEAALKSIDPLYLKAMMHRAVNDRLHRKVEQVLYAHDHLDDPSMLYFLLARAFGSKVNALPFELLTNQLPLHVVKRLKENVQSRSLLVSSGLFEDVPTSDSLKKIHVHALDRSIWKRKGLRPSSFPEKRLEQFASFVQACNFEFLAHQLNPREAYAYLCEVLKSENLVVQVSEALLGQLLINALVPFYWYKSQKEENGDLQEYILSFLKEIPAEQNYILKKWSKLGVYPKSAYESQALIELFNEYCFKKKCLHCQVGVKILKGD